MSFCYISFFTIKLICIATVKSYALLLSVLLKSSAETLVSQLINISSLTAVSLLLRDHRVVLASPHLMVESIYRST